MAHLNVIVVCAFALLAVSSFAEAHHVSATTVLRRGGSYSSGKATVSTSGAGSAFAGSRTRIGSKAYVRQEVRKESRNIMKEQHESRQRSRGWPSPKASSKSRRVTPSKPRKAASKTRKLAPSPTARSRLSRRNQFPAPSWPRSGWTSSSSRSYYRRQFRD